MGRRSSIELKQTESIDSAEKKKRIRIEEILERIREIEKQNEQYIDISLLNVEVYQKQFGTGIVISQNKYNVKVRFVSGEKTYRITKKYSFCPIFEDHEEIINAFTQWEKNDEERLKLSRELERLER